MRKTKVLCVVLACTMVLSGSIPAWATQSDSTSLEIEILDSTDQTSELSSDQISLDDLTDTTDCTDETYIASDEEIEQALENGVEGMPAIEETLAEEAEAEAEDTSSNTASTLSVAQSEYKVDSIHGDNRYATAAEIARSAFPNGVSSGYAIIVCGENGAWPDSLTSNSLAGAIDCPILYTRTSSLPSDTSEVLDELGVSDILIVGGSSRVSESVEELLSSSGYTVSRLYGNDRYETQLEVFSYGLERDLWNLSLGLVATGSNYPDALSISSLAFSEAAPLFLLPSDGAFSDEQCEALLNSGIESFVAVGGSGLISEEVIGYLDGICAVSTGSYNLSNVVQLGGNNRYETSSLVARWEVSNGYLSWNYAAFASGTSPSDALVGGVLQGTTGSVLLLISDSNTSTLSTLSSRSVSAVRVFGGTAAVSQLTRNDIALELGFDLMDIEGVKIYVDAGHGYNNTGNGAYDPGAVSGSYREAELNVELATLVANRLTAAGVDVFLNDDGGPYYYRHAEAIALDCNAIVSIHFNSGGGSGSMSLIHDRNASCWSSYIQDVIHPYLVSGTGLSDRGQITQAVAVLSGSLPAVLLETCFVDSSYDMRVYVANKNRVATSITNGILEM